MSKLQKFSDIEQFRNVLRNIQHKAQWTGQLDAAGDPIMNRTATLPKVKYEATTKIHGSNLSLRLEGRNNEISTTDDCYGFAKFIGTLPSSIIDSFRTLFGDNVVIFGEWFGKGVQDTVAVSQLDKKWAIFRVQKIAENDEKSIWISLDNIDFTPFNEYNIYGVRQFGAKYIEIDFEHPADDINKINQWVLEVEAECPVGKYFGVSGIGEGLVLASSDPEYQNSKFVFKAKGSQHSKSKVKTLAAVDTVKLKSIDDFVERYVSNERCQQAYDFIKNQNVEVNETKTGDFLRWLVNDINKEEADTITANGLTPKEINGAISKQGRKWFFNKLNKNVGL